MRSSKRMFLAVSASTVVAVGGAWGAVAMAASGSGAKAPTPRHHIFMNSRTMQHHCPNMGASFSSADL